MGVNHGERGTSPPEFGVGKLMQIVPQILSCFTISSTRLLALQCSKKLTNPMTLTAYSQLPKSTSSTSTKSPFQAEKLTFFWPGYGQKIPLRIHQNTPFQVKNSFFSGEGASPLPRSPFGGKGTPSPHPTPHPVKPSRSASASPRI